MSSTMLETMELCPKFSESFKGNNCKKSNTSFDDTLVVKETTYNNARLVNKYNNSNHNETFMGSSSETLIPPSNKYDNNTVSECSQLLTSSCETLLVSHVDTITIYQVCNAKQEQYSFSFF